MKPPVPSHLLMKGSFMTRFAEENVEEATFALQAHIIKGVFDFRSYFGVKKSYLRGKTEQAGKALMGVSQPRAGSQSRGSPRALPTHVIPSFYPDRVFQVSHTPEPVMICI